MIPNMFDARCLPLQWDTSFCCGTWHGCNVVCATRTPSDRYCSGPSYYFLFGGSQAQTAVELMKL